MVLSKEPHHFEAKMLNEHGGVWESMLSFPYWDEQQTSLHPLMLSRFNSGTAFQLVRDGLQKTVAIVAGGPPDPLDKHTQVKAKWVLSKTPYGSIVAYYVSIQVPMNKPVNLEMFLASAKPPLFKPTEACFLLQQLAFTPYCFIVLTNQGKVVLNKRMILGTSTIREVRDIAKQVSEQESYIGESQIKSACQWHMNNFDMDHLKFD